MKQRRVTGQRASERERKRRREEKEREWGGEGAAAFLAFLSSGRG